jgi:hypothetical protein
VRPLGVEGFFVSGQGRQLASSPPAREDGMTKWVVYGYGPEQDPEARRAQEIEDGLLREHFAVILENLDLILDTPRYFFCLLRSAWFSCLWVYGGGRIPLGVLALLWNEGKMLYSCPSCGFRLHAVGLTGSILTGIRSARGFCAGCGQKQTLRNPSGHDDLIAVGKLVGIHRNEPVVERERARFSTGRMV